MPIFARTGNVVFVSDSCHSASVTRGNVVGVRSVAADPRPHPLGRQVFDTPDTIPGIRIGAARDRETAVEIRTEDGGEDGLFTWYWLQALDQAVSGETWDGVYKRTYTLVTTHQGAYQRPQLEGDPSRAVFGGAFSPRNRRVAVLGVDARCNRVEVDAGLANGATVGSLYGLYGTGQPDLPELRLEEVGVFTSQGVPTRGAFKRGDLLVETEHAYAFEPIRLYVDGDVRDSQDRSLIQRLEASLRELDGFSVVGDRFTAEWIVYVLRPRRHGAGFVYGSDAHTLPKSFPDAAPEVLVISLQEALLHERMRISLADPRKGIAILQENLSKFARVQEIKRIASVAGAVDVELQYYLLRPEPGCQGDCIELFGPDGRKKSYRKEGPFDASQVATREPRRGDVLGFAIRNKDREGYYAYLINVAPGGDVQPIFPQPYHSAKSARVDGGEFRDLSAKLALMFDATGEEYIKLIVTTQPVDVAVFRSGGYRGLTRSTRGANPLERLPAEALHTRDQAVRMPDADWDTRDAVRSVEYAPDGQFAATGGDNGRILSGNWPVGGSCGASEPMRTG